MSDVKEPNEALVQSVAKDFSDGLHCSQVSFAYAAKKLGFDEKTARKIGAGFGGGMFAGERCGAVTGALMGLGLAYGHSSKEDKPNEATLQKKKKIFEEKFKEKYGSLICADILGASFGTEEGTKKIMEENRLSGCPALTAYACELLDELIDE